MAIQFNLNALSRFSNVNFDVSEILFSLDSKFVEAPYEDKIIEIK